MKVKRWREYGIGAWMAGVALIPLAVWSAQFSYLHEWGHLVFGFGGTCSAHFSTIHVQWYGSDIAGSVFPMLLLCFAGRIARSSIPPLWALSGVMAWLNNGWEYYSLGPYADYPYHSIPHLWGILVISLICVYTLCKPSTRGVVWPYLRPEFSQAWQEAKGNHAAENAHSGKQPRQGDDLHKRGIRGAIIR